MLIVPADSRYLRNRVAFVTWLLVVVNALVFLHTARPSPGADDEVERFYRDSAPPVLEFPHYLQALRERGDRRTLDLLLDESPQQPSAHAVTLMLRDHEFQAALERGDVVTPQNPQHEQWHRLRREFRRALRDASGLRHALDPGELRVSGFLSYQFLHGGLDHLIGNMVILVLVGRLVEGAIGAWRFLAVYLLTGAAAGASFVALRLGVGVDQPLVGASGAIAGIMGLFAVLFATRRVRFFYFVVAYAGFATLPALLVLGYWIAWELLQYLFLSDTVVAYEAHLGGLVAGALCVAFLRRLPGAAQAQAMLDQPEQDRRYEQDLQEGVHLMGRLQVDAAQRLFEKLHRQRPQDPRPLEGWFTLVKMAPQSPEYHRLCTRILTLPASAPMKDLAAVVRDHYLAQAQPALLLPAPLLTDLLVYYARRGRAAETDRLLKPVIESGVQDGRIREALLTLAQAVPESKARAYRALAARRFP